MTLVLRARGIQMNVLKKFIIPKDPIGASIIGFTIRKDDKDKYKNISDFAKQNGRLVPISPQNAQWNVIKDYNDEHKDQPIELTSRKSFQSFRCLCLGSGKSL